MKNQEFKMGDLVRISSCKDSPDKHWHKWGAVGIVTMAPNYYGNIDVKVGILVQGIPARELKMAKQAMKKRDQYGARRG